ncbi:MAG: hypothetical protein JNM70_13630 [Anaerolineae bacterium]|nr:hypothetical protein [Anaerolineae bacterium]
MNPRRAFTRLGRGLLAGALLMLAFPVIAQSDPTLADFWDGLAEWVLETADVGLPIGESDTLLRPDGTYWSYLHASDQSAGIVDQCGEPVAFPGCLTLWRSADGAQSFALAEPMCLMACQSCPCDDVRDHITAQQYPRVAVAEDGQHYLAYEWHAQVMLRRSDDGLNWSDWSYLLTPGGTWPSSYAPCTPTEKIGPHPNIRGEVHDCLVGAPPGLYIDGNTLYVFVAAGSAPGHMRCYKGDRHGDLGRLQRCQTDPLFEGAPEYGPTEITSGPEIAAYFDFRYVSSAEVMKVGDRYYMAYEGIRGPDQLERGMDTQFGLGFARSTTSAIDGPWEKFPGNPVIQPVAFNWGIGHADLLLIDGQTVMITATSQETRGRYVLRWK